jgi:hypothetical protein
MGSNSFFGKMGSQDAVGNWLGGMGIQSPMYNAGQAYAARNNVTASPTPFAGVQPTLSDANNGYLQQSQRVAQQQQRPIGASPYQSSYRV